MLGVSGLLGNSGDGAAAESGGNGEVGVAPPEIGGVSEEDKGRIEESDRSSGGNRWPRQETLALLQIRSDMDIAFRDSSLKGPLWDEVSRKLAELGYNRSAKKCKEKFENVYKYHRRTKEGRSTKPEGKTYRFFDQLQALENHNNSLPILPPLQKPQPPLLEAPQITVSSQTSPSNIPSQINMNPPPLPPPPPPQQPPQPPPPANPSQNRNFPVNFIMNTSSPSSSSSTSSDEEPERRCKRKRKWEYFFERIMKEVIQKQEEMQKSFLEALEKRERDRMVREEAWRVQEIDRMNREHELLVQERAMAAAKDAAVMNFLQKVAEQQNPNANAAQMKIQTQMPIPITVLPVQENPIPQQNPNAAQMKIQTQIPVPVLQESPIPQQNPNAAQMKIQTQLPIPVPVQENPIPQQTQMKIQTQIPMPVPVQENQIPQQHPNAAQMKIQTQIQENPKVNDNGGEKFNTSISSRWPKPEVEALIKLRTNLDMKYQENGPKGPLWEEISLSMNKLGYNRSSKRCKEKWENINKYFKKVKESNKRRPEDSKTCPYFHQLDALYREKKHIGFSNSFDSGLPMKPEINSMVPIMAQPEQQWPLPQNQTAMEDQESENHDDGDDDNEDEEDEGGGYEVVANKPSSVATAVE